MGNVNEQRAVRVRDTYRGANLYTVLVFDDDGNPVDLTASTSSETINLDQNTLSNIDALAAMTSLSLREFDLDYVISELLMTARGPNTLPSIFANVLLEHGGKNGR